MAAVGPRTSGDNRGTERISRTLDKTETWCGDLRNFSVLRPLLDRVAAPEDRRLGERIFDAYAEHVQGRIPQLRHPSGSRRLQRPQHTCRR